MKWLNILAARLRALVRREDVLRDTEEELRIHIEMETEKNLERGMAPEEARAAARRSFGDPGRMGDLAHDVRGAGWVDALWQDLRYGYRQLVKNPGFTAVAALSLALGVGANTAIFSLVDAVLLKSLPVDRPDQLYFIQNVGPRRTSGGAPPYPCFARFRDQSRFFAGLAAFTPRDPRVDIDGRVEEVTGQLVSGNYFSLLGVNAALGRTLGAADDATPGNGGPEGLAAVIGHNYWTRRFGRSPEVIGKIIHVGDQPVTIVGVAPPEFYGLIPGREADISLPISSVGAEMLAERQSWWFQAVGRLKPGAQAEQARAELDTIFQSYMNELNFNAEMRRDAFARIALAPAGKGLDSLRRQYSKPLQALMAIVVMALLIACANVANLLLARAAARRKEFAVRLALGPSRLRLIRQLLTESLLLVSLGGLLGLLFAVWGRSFLVSFFATGRGRVFVNLSLDYRVLTFTAGVALLTGLIFGLAPALQATRIDPNPALKDGAGAGSLVRARFGKSLVVAQVAISLLMLVGAGLFVRTLYNLKSADAGFRPEGVLTMRVSPAEANYQGARLLNLWKELLARVERLPGVRSASLSALSPLDGSDRGVLVDVSGFPAQSNRDKEIRLNQVSPGYFQTFGIALREGRGFTENDNESAPKVALLNESAARFYFNGRSPVGAQITFFPGRPTATTYQVVGVTQDSRSESLRDPDTRLVYLPVAQKLDRLGRLTLAARSDARPTDLTGAIRGAVGSIGPDILLLNIATLNEQVDQSLLQERLVATLSVFFGLLALLLACIGLYGVMSYDVSRRTREVGVRMALGARRADILRLFLGQSMKLVLIGSAAGLAVSLAVSRLLSSLLFGVGARDPVAFTACALFLAVVALLASYLPARRAAKVTATVALRHE